MQNFGKIKNTFNELLAVELMLENKNNKELFKKYVKGIRESKILNTEFLVITNIENKIESDREKATQFVKENIALFSNFNKKDILEVNKKLASFISLSDDDIVADYEFKDLHENISKLIFAKKTPNTIEDIIETTGKVVDYILNNKPKTVNESIELPTSMLSTMMVDKYNEKYNDLNESEKNLIKVLIDSTPEEKKEIYLKTVRECIDLINEKFIDSDINAKDKLLRVKDKLLNDKQDLTEDFEDKIYKLIELKDTLKNN